MSSTVTATSVLAAASAQTAGFIAFNVVALLGGVGLIVGGVRRLRRPGGGGGRKAGAIVMIVLGALLILGLLSSVTGGARTSA